MHPPLPTVLYVEDDADDLLFFTRAIRKLNVKCDLQTVPTAVVAKSYLAGKTPYGDRTRFPMPSLVLTDITGPPVGGSTLELVSWIRDTPEVAHLPIICATGNEHPQTLQDFAKVGVICHAKTSHMTEIAQVVKDALKQCRPG